MTLRLLLRVILCVATLALESTDLGAAESASQCPEQLKRVDALLKRNPKLPAEELAKAKKLRDQGEVLIKGGKIKECRIALNRAEKMLAKGLK